MKKDVSIGMMNGLPNIVLVVCDTLGAKHMSLYGYERKTTPALEELVEKEGFVLYERCYSTSCWTPPSHASLFTGLYPSQHGVHEGNYFLRNNLITLPEVLRESGYYTLGISCNGLVSKNSNFHRGFVKFFELDRWSLFPEDDPEIIELRKVVADINGDFSKAWGCFVWSLKNKRLLTPIKYMANVLFRRVKGVNEGRFGVTRNSTPYTAKAVNICERELRRAKQPFFIFINLMQTHHKYNPPRETRGKWSDPKSPYRKHPQYCIKHYIHPFKDEVLAYFNDLYDEEVLYLDRVLHSLYYKIKSIMGDNSLFIITSDHGEQFGEDGHFGHILSLNDAVLRIPLLVRYPGARSFQREDRLVQINDLFSTILDVMDSPLPRPETSLSLLSSSRREKGLAEIVVPEFWLSMISKQWEKKGSFRRIIE